LAGRRFAPRGIRFHSGSRLFPRRALIAMRRKPAHASVSSTPRSQYRCEPTRNRSAGAWPLRAAPNLVQTGTSPRRVPPSSSEIARLTDAVAQLGLSNALRARLVDAEAEYADLTARVDWKAPTLPSAEAIGAKIREVAVRLETAPTQDVCAARAILSGKLGPVVLEERDGAVWAQMEIGPAPLLAAGADSDSIRGCGGLLL
jgi:hypothetical protein